MLRRSERERLRKSLSWLAGNCATVLRYRRSLDVLVSTSAEILDVDKLSRSDVFAAFLAFAGRNKANAKFRARRSA